MPSFLAFQFKKFYYMYIFYLFICYIYMLCKRLGTQTGTTYIYLVITRLFEKIKFLPFPVEYPT